MRTRLSLCCIGLLVASVIGCGDEATRVPGANSALVDGSSDGSGADLDVTTPSDDTDAGGAPEDDTSVPTPDDAQTVGDAGPGPESNCGNGVDDNFDGNVDCADPSCLESTECAGLAPTEFNCVDGIDNDGNGFADCVDDQCARSPVCRDDVGDADAGTLPDDTGTPEADAGPTPPVDAGPPGPDRDGGGVPPIPFEFECGDGIDNDGDGDADCDDDNCEFIPPCLGGGGGGGLPPIPFEFQCGDGIDNDRDGLLDCDDDNCNFIPPCLGR